MRVPIKVGDPDYETSQYEFQATESWWNNYLRTKYIDKNEKMYDQMGRLIDRGR